jgi:hypothetical protein
MIIQMLSYIVIFFFQVIIVSALLFAVIYYYKRHKWSYLKTRKVVLKDKPDFTLKK